MTYAEKPATGSTNVYFGIEWNEANYSETFTIKPVIYRWDRQNTDNSGGRWSEDITKTSGSGTDSWSGLSYVAGSGYRTIDTFSTRTYTKTHSTQTIYYHLYTDANFGTYYNGWTTLGAQTWTFTMTIPAKTSYTVSYSANGGSGAPSSQTKWYGETLTLTSSKPTRTGYSFVRWNTKSDGSGTNYSSGASYTGNAAITLYAQWTPSTYTVSYSANGGSGAPSAQTKTAGKALTLTTSKPTRTGYNFTKWNTKSDGTGTSYSSGGSYTTDANVTLYAQWTKITYTVSYSANGGSGAPGSQTKTYGTALTLSSTKPTRTGYTFSKWNTAANGSGTNYSSGASYTANAAATLYAQWTANTWYVKYNGNGSTGGSMSNSTHTYDTAKNLTANSFTRAHTVTYNHNYSGSSNATATATYSFSKWNTASDGSGTDYSNQASVKNLTSTAGGTVNLYARWTSASVTLRTPTRTGHTFGGWYKESACTNKVGNAGASYTPTANITLYAKWTADTYTISYDANGGSGAPSSQTKTYGTTLNLSSTKPTRSGWKFLGWATSSAAASAVYQPGDGYTANSGTTLYAVWEATPTITSLTGVRCDSSGTAQDDGAYAKVTAVWSCSQSATAKLYKGTTEVTSGKSGTWSGTSGTATAIVSGIELASQYTFKFQVTNGSQTVTRSVIVTRAFFTMDFRAGGAGVGILSAAPASGLAVGGDVMSDGEVSAIDANQVIHKLTKKAESASLGSYLPLAGGTMTGNLQMSSNDVRIRDSVIDKDGTPPSEALYSPKFRILDKDGSSIGYMECVQNATTGSMATRLLTFNDNNGDSSWTSLSLRHPKDTANGGGNLETSGSIEAHRFYRLDADDNNYGTIRFASTNRTGDAIRFYGATDGNGDGIVIGDGGMTVIGSGESAINWYNRILGTADPSHYSKTPGTETTFVTSDNSIVFVCNADTVANRKIALFNNSANLALHESTVDTSKSNNNISESVYRTVYASDVNDKIYAYFQATAEPSGATSVQLRARNQLNGANRDNGFSMAVAADGTRSVSFTDSSIWRTALGLSDTPTSVTTITSVITVNSTNATISSVNYKQWGKVASLRITWTNNSAISVPASGNISNFTIGTIVEGKRPAVNEAVWQTDGDNAGAAWGFINSSGTMNMGAAEGTGAARTIAADSTFVCFVTYILA